MKWTNWRNIAGVILLLLGVVALLQALQVLPENSSFLAIVFAVLFAGGGVAFLSVLFNDRRNWWAAIPGIVLISLGVLIAVSTLSPDLGEKFGGPIFLAGISLAFWVVYFLSPQNWWAVIPGGTLLTLAAVAGLDSTSSIETGGVFFIGLALTFALLALLPVQEKRMSWPWIPAGILFVMGVLIMASAANIVNYVWPVALILGGCFLLYQAFWKKA